MSEKDVAMESDRSVRINWGVFNIPTILAVAGVLFYTAQKQERQDARLDTIEQNRLATDKAIDEIKNAVAPISNLTYRVTVTEQGIVAGNSRVDRVVDSLGGKLDNISESVNTLRTDVKVLSQKIDANTKAEPTAFRLTR